MRRDINERPPEMMKVNREGEHDVKYVFHKPIHRDRPCCSGIKHLHWPDEAQAAAERLENAVFNAQQEALQEQPEPQPPAESEPEPGG